MWKQFRSGKDRCMVNVRTGHIIIYRNGVDVDRVDVHINSRLDYNLSVNVRKVLRGDRNE